jgi:hypothetical protein
MPTRLMSFLLIALALAACGSEATSKALAPAPTSTTTVAPLAPVTRAPSTSTTTVAPPDFTRFIAAVDAVLADTSYQNAALADPEVFIATGQLFCELLDDGATTDDVLSEHLDALAAVSEGEITDADTAASGVVLGASIAIICPHHGP